MHVTTFTPDDAQHHQLESIGILSDYLLTLSGTMHVGVHTKHASIYIEYSDYLPYTIVQEFSPKLKEARYDHRNDAEADFLNRVRRILSDEAARA